MGADMSFNDGDVLEFALRRHPLGATKFWQRNKLKAQLAAIEAKELEAKANKELLDEIEELRGKIIKAGETPCV